MAKGKLSKLFKGKDTYGEEIKEAKAIKSGKITPSEYAKGEDMEKAKCMKCGGKTKKYAGGGDIDIEPDMGSISPKKKAAPKPKNFAKGGGIEVRGKTKGRLV